VCENDQDTNVIVIGSETGQTNQTNNSIIRNDSETALNTLTPTSLFIKPIRGVVHGLGVGVLHYDPASSEITYSTN